MFHKNDLRVSASVDSEDTNKNKQPKKSKIKKLIIAIIAVVVICTIYNSYNSSNNKNSNDNNKTPKTEQVSNDNTDVTSDIKKNGLYKVIDVVDGDTIKISLNNKVETVRLVGVDTPETKDPRKPIQCFGKEASQKTHELVANKQVYIEKDSSQGERDKYGRLLLFIFTEDGKNVAYELIKQGYGHEYTYNSIPYKYQTAFKKAEQDARNNKRGLWADNTCNGDTTKPVNNNGVKNNNSNHNQVAPSDQPKTVNQPVSNGVQSNENAYYPNCAAARKAGVAPIYRGQPGYRAALDRDNDGIACE